MKTFALASILLLSAVHAAAADVCVVLDEQRDTLDPGDRKSATVSFGGALAKAGMNVTNTNCTETYTFYNVKLGSTITVYVQSPRGNRDAKVSRIDDLPNIYEQMAKSLSTGAPMGSLDNTDRTNVTTEQMAPKRVSADGLKYARLGYGAVTGKSTDLGTAFGFGYRYELDALAIDVSMNFVWASGDAMTSSGTTSRGGVNGELIGIGAVHYQDPYANNVMYYGGRIGYGLNDFFDDSNGYYTNFTGSGLQVTGVAGYEMLRASTIRLFFELDATAPLYTSSGTEYDLNGGTGGTVKRWAPVVSLTLGAGWGHGNAVNVVNR